jgi:hypothetical protein
MKARTVLESSAEVTALLWLLAQVVAESRAMVSACLVSAVAPRGLRWTSRSSSIWL